MKDMHSNISVVHAITPQAIGTTGIAGGQLSAVLDRRGFNSAEFIVSHGASATVADTIEQIIYECATTGGTFTSVASADLMPNTGEPTLTRTTGGASARLGYRGNKRYLKIRAYGVGGATGDVSAVLVLGDPESAPVADS
ncbi:MAG TPA: hypothetical protein DCG72_04625 [Gammaproteobacteria bacterium]|nr:hypothetical protein [Gammaproteobacteria bacterium]